MANVPEPAVANAPTPGAPGQEATLSLLTATAGIAFDGAADGDGYGALKERLRGLATRDPIDTLLATVLGGGLLFHLAERDHNPRCATLWDSVLYAATSLSVGYDDVFPKTPLGNVIAAAIQTFGPAMAASAFEPPSAESAAAEQARATAAIADAATQAELLEVNRAILARLDEIAASLAAGPNRETVAPR